MSSNVKQSVKCNLNMSSDTENIFQNTKYSLPKDSRLQKEVVPLKLKLKRSTEQSSYSIDTESDYEKSSHKTRNQPQRQKKESNSEAEGDESCMDTEDNSKTSQVCEETIEPPRKSRVRKPPLRLSYYQCDTLSPPKSPSLRTRKNVNYNEDKLLINSIVTNLKEKNREENKPLAGSNGKQNLRSKHLNVKNNKRSRTSRTDTDSETSPKSMKKSDESENSINVSPVKSIEHESTNFEVENSSATRIDEPKRTISEQEELIVTKNNSNDMYIRIKISSAKKSNPTLQKGTPRGKSRAKKNVALQQEEINLSTPKTCSIKHGNLTPPIVTKNNSDEEGEEESLADMYRRIKISSAKKSNLSPQKGTARRKSRAQKNIAVQLKETNLSTPKSRSIKHSNLTPSLSKRNISVLKPSTPLQEARTRLHLSAVPKSLPCREEEFNSIFTFLRDKLQDKTGGCIYISGVPGTGKTATVNEAIQCLQKMIIRGELDEFNYVQINSMKLTEPRQAYVQILKQLNGKTATWEQAYRILEKKFHNVNSKMTLLLVDELEFLCTKRQDVVYNILDWPTKSTAQLVVITIANTMDLPERILKCRVTSRLGLTRLTFHPYSYKQLQEIVMSRLKGFKGFRAEAVELVARKVSALSGDARRALDICRRAIEIAESQNAETISLQNVTEAVYGMIGSPKVQAIKHCSQIEKIFLQAISAEVTRTSIEEVYFKDAYRQLVSLCSFEGIEIPSVTAILAVCERLGSNKLLLCECSRNDIYQKIFLNVTRDDIHYAIQELDLDSA